MKFNLDVDHINYIKIHYKDNQDSPCCVKAAVKRIGEKEIFACAKFEDGLLLHTPQSVTISFICENGLYRTNTELKYIESEPPYVFFTLSTPLGTEFQQNREYFRVKSTEDTLLTYLYNSSFYKINTQIYDISASGIKLILPERINEPEEAFIDIKFDDCNITVKAEFIRFDDEDNILKISFKFINLSDAHRDIISQKCIQKQLENRRKNRFS